LTYEHTFDMLVSGSEHTFGGSGANGPGNVDVDFNRSTSDMDHGFVSHPVDRFGLWEVPAAARPTKDGGPTRRQHEMISQRSASARALVIISTIVAGLVLLLATAVHAFGGSAPIDTIDYQVRSGDSQPPGWA
jgi:hypothetical protein